MRSEQRSAFLLIIDPHFLEDLKYWTGTDPKVALKILILVEHISRDPFKGIGKPELLKALGAWSRRITQEHRIVYRVDSGRIYLLMCRYHYR
jgi:toxin YoeB